MLDLLGSAENNGIDLMETTAKTRQCTQMRVDRRPTQVLEVVVVEMDSIQTGLSRQDLLEIGVIVVYEMR
jgi:hypothetical protein